MSPKLPSDKDLIRTGIRLAKTICGWCSQPVRGLLKQLSVEPRDYKDPNNVTRSLDGAAHNLAVLELRQQFGQNIYIYGEEASHTPESFQRINKVVALVDAIDGTDLVARGFSNWCSAFAFLHPKQKRILASVIGHSSGEIYYASSQGAFKKTVEGKIIRLKRSPEEQLSLEKATVCFFGQKPHNLLTVMKDESSAGFQEKLATFRHRMREQREKLPFRLYNFGGNPMMVKIPDRTVDAVFELSGQKAHDVIPGAYIATQAGAVFIDMQGNEIDLVQALLTPSKKLKYVLAATMSLSQELRTLLATSNKSLISSSPPFATGASVSAISKESLSQALPFDAELRGEK
jgi:fructose-1,6-bisphosphatase/inositol monophosphatase family enzyme